MLEKAIDKVKTSQDPVDIILVGGGSIIIPQPFKIEGVKQIIRPKYFEVANALGAGICQVSANINKII